MVEVALAARAARVVAGRGGLGAAAGDPEPERPASSSTSTTTSRNRLALLLARRKSISPAPIDPPSAATTRSLASASRASHDSRSTNQPARTRSSLGCGPHALLIAAPGSPVRSSPSAKDWRTSGGRLPQEKSDVRKVILLVESRMMVP